MKHEEPANPSDDFLEEELLKMWRRALDTDQLTIDDDFFESGGDSLLAAQLLLEIEKLTKKKLPTSLIFETGTVRELLKRVKLSDEQSPLLGFGNKIIHLFHGDFHFGGTGVKYYLKMLGNDHRIHVIPPHIPQEGDLLISIEDMASERVQRVIEKQPNGPYILVGGCTGSLIAFEVARLLVSMGKEVKAMVMVDPVIVSVRRSAQAFLKTKDFFMCLRGVPKDKRREHLVITWKKMYEWDSKTKDTWRLTHLIKVWKKMPLTRCRIFDIPHPVRYIFHRSWRDRIKSLSESNGAKKQRLVEGMINPGYAFERSKYYWNVLSNYRPFPLDVPVLYVSLEFSGRAWRRIAPNTTYVNISRGVHVFYLEDYAQHIFDKIREFIDR